MMSHNADDAKIIKLFWNRDEKALAEVSKAYGRFCSSIAGNILDNEQDVEECVNDAYLATWNTIPPQKPAFLAPFLGRITRNLAINRYKKNHAEKRGGGSSELILEELQEVIPGGISADSELIRKDMLEVINRFLSSLSPDKRKIFVRRYWYSDPISRIASATGLSENHIAVTLSRMRKTLHKLLSEGGFDL